MNANLTGPAMSQKIFAMNLDVEAVSLYLLCCALADAGAPVTRETLQEKWNGSPDELEKQLALLESRSIVRREAGKEGSADLYTVMDEKRWR